MSAGFAGLKALRSRGSPSTATLLAYADVAATATARSRISWRFGPR